MDKSTPADIDKEKHTAHVMRRVADSIMPSSLKFEVDVPSNYRDNLLPILDLKMGINEGKLVFYFYSKSMASQNVVHMRSALTSKQKMNILVEEGCRRLKNFSPTLPWRTKVNALNKLMIQMYQVEHKESFREKVADRIIAKYKDTLMNHVSGKKPMYRSRHEREAFMLTDEGRRKTSSNWFKKTGASNVLWVPTTIEKSFVNEIKKKLEDIEAPSKLKTMVVEKRGRSVKEMLKVSNPFPKENCGRDIRPWRMRG